MMSCQLYYSVAFYVLLVVLFSSLLFVDIRRHKVLIEAYSSETQQYIVRHVEKKNCKRDTILFRIIYNETYCTLFRLIAKKHQSLSLYRVYRNYLLEKGLFWQNRQQRFYN